MDSKSPADGVETRRFPLLRVLGTLVSSGLLVYLIYRQGWSEFRQAFATFPWTAVALALGLVLASRGLVAMRWYALLRTAGAPIDLWQVIKLVFTGLFTSNFLPSTIGGDAARLAGGIYLRLDASMLAASLMVDRLVGMAGMALMLPAGLAVVLAAGAVEPVMEGALLAGFPWAGRLWAKAVEFFHGMLRSSLTWLRHPAGLAWAFACTFGHMLFTFLTVHVLLRSLGATLPLWQVGGLWSFSYFVSLAPFSINGLGLQEVSIAYLYATFGGIPVEAGLALAVLLRVLFMLASLPGAIFLPMIGRRTPPNLS